MSTTDAVIARDSAQLTPCRARHTRRYVHKKVSLALTFDKEKWSLEIRESINAYAALHDPIVCSDVMRKHYSNSKLIECIGLGASVIQKEETGKELSPEEIQEIKEQYIKEFSDDALQGILIYRRQMVIISSTIFEAMLTEFLKNYFQEFPEKMHDYATPNGLIRFKEILDFQKKMILLCIMLIFQQKPL